MGALLRTLAIVKPDAVRAGRALDIRQRAELEGFTVLAQQHVQASNLGEAPGTIPYSPGSSSMSDFVEGSRS